MCAVFFLSGICLYVAAGDVRPLRKLVENDELSFNCS